MESIKNMRSLNFKVSDKTRQLSLNTIVIKSAIKTRASQVGAASSTGAAEEGAPELGRI